MKCESKISPNCLKTIKKGKEKYYLGIVCCDWCYNKMKIMKNIKK